MRFVCVCVCVCARARVCAEQRATDAPSHVRSVKPFMFSTIVGIDVIPRLSVKTLYKLRDQVMKYFPQCKVLARVQSWPICAASHHPLVRQVSKWSLYSKFWSTSNYAAVFGSNDLKVADVLAAERTNSMRMREEQARKLRAEVGAGSEEAKAGAVVTPPSGAAGHSARSDDGLTVPSPAQGASNSTTLLMLPSTLTMDQTSLFPPGTIIHLVRSRVVRGCCGCASVEEFEPTLAPRAYFEVRVERVVPCKRGFRYCHLTHSSCWFAASASGSAHDA